MALNPFWSNPWTMFGASVLPGILGSLVPHDDPRKLRAQAMQLFDPSYLDNQTNDIFRGIIGGAGYSGARSELIGGAQAGQGAVQRHLAQTGLGNSGVGAAIQGAVGAAPGMALSKLSAAAWQQAMQQAFQGSQMKANALMGMPMSQGKGLPLFAGGINALLPMLMRMMQSQQGFGSQWDQGPGRQYDTYGSQP